MRSLALDIVTVSRDQLDTVAVHVIGRKLDIVPKGQGQLDKVYVGIVGGSR